MKVLWMVKRTGVRRKRLSEFGSVHVDVTANDIWMGHGLGLSASALGTG